MDHKAKKMSGEKYNSRLRAAVYQRILTDNIVGIDLQENNTTRWHDEKIRDQTITEGSAVLSHAGAIVGTTATLGGTSLDEKIVSIANVFRLLYQKRRYDVEDTPLWWTWKYGKVTMRIALERMHRWVYSTRPMDVIVLMRYAMTSFYVLADEGIPNERTDVVFDLKNILAYRINREKDAKELGDEPYDEFTDLSIALKDITDNLNGEYSTGEGKRIIEIEFPDESISSDGELEISWKKKIVDDNEEAKRKVLTDLESEKSRLERNDENLSAEDRKKKLQSVTLQISSMTAGGKLLNSRDSTLSEELFLETEEDENGKIKIISYKPKTTMEKIQELAKEQASKKIGKSKKKRGQC